MILTNKEIIELNLLSDIEPECLSGVSYDLQINEIIELENYGIVDKVILPPQGMAIAISKEEFNLPDNVTAYTTVKNRLSLKGIMAVNIGVVDPGFSGPIASLLINFGRDNFVLEKGRQFLRLTFHTFDRERLAPIGRKMPVFDTRGEYLEERIKDAKSLDSKFLSLKKTIEEVKRDILDSNEKKIDEAKKDARKDIKDTVDGAIKLAFTIIAGLVSLIIFWRTVIIPTIEVITNNKAKTEEIDSLRNITKTYESRFKNIESNILKPTIPASGTAPTSATTNQ
ncbi:hypothetical protein IC229_04240 [Spirosoma sp. BT702]|uniref:dUTPase-like domain-containing protein n=1 Tax=Spirosoma profusum TaxID=2771354 RepID=A0A926XTJ2_9BACT|nr:hypothetical protein [Spirosoma profusum]MBD2699832.1 hypothetical protein [Spirosoma profusum]